jgi:tRNA G26 N,N-dimethylase Trm1
MFSAWRGSLRICFLRNSLRNVSCWKYTKSIDWVNNTPRNQIILPLLQINSLHKFRTNVKKKMETDEVEETNQQQEKSIILDEDTIIKEGKASILFPKGNMVFYNPVQEVNRDLSIMAIKLYLEQLAVERKEIG